jgi:O-antigen/teichoic acid export membrane protein
LFVFSVGRFYGTAGIGVLALAQSLLFGGNLIARGGMDRTLMLYVGRNPSSRFVFHYLKWAMNRGLLLAIIISIAIYAARFWFESLFDAKGLAELLVGVSIAVPFFVLSYLLAGFFKGIHMPATACMMENGSVSLNAIILLFVSLAFEIEKTYMLIGCCLLVAGMFVAAQGIIQATLWWRISRRKALEVRSEEAVSEHELQSVSRSFFVLNIAAFVQNFLAVMIAGFFLSSADLGLFKAAQQVGLTIAFVLIVINAIFPPRFASLYHQGKMDELSRLARFGSVLGGAISFPIAAICILAPEWVLHWFGPEFTSGAVILRVIAFAQFVNVGTGSVAILLNMTGNDKLMRNISVITNLIGLVGFWVLIPPFGALGAAIALAFILIMQNLVALVYVWRVLGVWVLPIPNFLEYFGAR